MPASNGEKDISTIIKKVEGKGAAGYWFITESSDDKTAKINAKELGQIKADVEKAITKNKNFTIEQILLNPLCNWSDKKTFMKDLETANVTNEEAYRFMVAGKKIGPVQKTDAEKLASILINFEKNLNASALFERLEALMKSSKEAAIKIVEDKEKAYGRSDGGMGWIYATSKDQRDKLASKKKTK